MTMFVWYETKIYGRKLQLESTKKNKFAENYTSAISDDFLGPLPLRKSTFGDEISNAIRKSAKKGDKDIIGW